MPSRFPEFRHHQISPTFILLACLRNGSASMFQGFDSAILDRQENAVVQTPLELPVGADCFAVAGQHTQPGAGHAVGLGKGIQFHARFKGTGK